MDYHKVLENILPYNDLFYRSCFYNSFFPVVHYFQKSIIPFLINDIISYEYPSGVPGKLDINFIESVSAEALRRKAGIITESRIGCDDIIHCVTASLSSDRPVIVYVDVFYEPIRKDTYLKAHCPHTLLIYGYNRLEQTLNIIEHRHKDNLSYEPRTLGYADLIQCYDGFIRNYHLQNPAPSYFDFRRDPAFNSNQRPTGTEIDRLAYLNHFHQNGAVILAKLDCLTDYGEDFTKIAGDAASLQANADTLIKSLNNIINAKLAEKYKLNRLDFATGPVELCERIILSWSLIRAKLVKFVYSSAYHRDDYGFVSDELKTIRQNETELLEILFGLRDQMKASFDWV
jgi:hypothetical protein